MESVAVPADTVEQFRREGHTVLRGVVPRTEIERYRPAVEAAVATNNRERRPIEDRDTYGKAFLQTINLWLVDETVRELVTSPRLAQVAATLLGCSGVRLYHDQALFKEPGGGPTPWHQDQFYWPFRDDRTITLWVPLADVGAVPGSMTFASGSHRLGAVSEQPISDASQQEVADIIARERLPCVTHGAMGAGDATFHAGWTLHRADGNPTDAMRPVMTVIYVADGIEVAEPANVFQEFDRQVWLGDAPPGTLVGGDLNPLLFPA